eukprot:gene4925-6139_t
MINMLNNKSPENTEVSPPFSPLSEKSKKSLLERIKKLSIDEKELEDILVRIALENDSMFPSPIDDDILHLQASYQKFKMIQEIGDPLKQAICNYFNILGLKKFKVLVENSNEEDWNSNFFIKLSTELKIKIEKEPIIEGIVKNGKVHWRVLIENKVINQKPDQTNSLFSEEHTWRMTPTTFYQFKNAGKRGGNTPITESFFVKSFEEKYQVQALGVWIELKDKMILDKRNLLTNEWRSLINTNIQLESIDRNVYRIQKYEVENKLKSVKADRNPISRDKFISLWNDKKQYRAGLIWDHLKKQKILDSKDKLIGGYIFKLSDFLKNVNLEYVDISNALNNIANKEEHWKPPDFFPDQNIFRPERSLKKWTSTSNLINASPKDEKYCTKRWDVGIYRDLHTHQNPRYNKKEGGLECDHIPSVSVLNVQANTTLEDYTNQKTTLKTEIERLEKKIDDRTITINEQNQNPLTRGMEKKEIDSDSTLKDWLIEKDKLKKKLGSLSISYDYIYKEVYSKGHGEYWFSISIPMKLHQEGKNFMQPHDQNKSKEHPFLSQVMEYFEKIFKRPKDFDINEEEYPIILGAFRYLYRQQVKYPRFISNKLSIGGLMLPQRNPFDGGYSFCFWICPEDFSNLKYKPGLYSFFTDDGNGIECVFNTKFQSLELQIKTKTKMPLIKSLKSQLSLYVNGRLEEKMPLLYPKTDKPYTRCHIGNSANLNCGFIGRIGSILMLNEYLNPPEVAQIYQFDKDSTLVTEKMPREGSVGIYNGELFLASGGRRNLKVIFLYHPKATDKALCFEISTGELSNAATIMEGINMIQTTSPLEQMIYIGGIRMIYPLFSQLGQNITGVETRPAEINEQTQFSTVEFEYTSIPASHSPSPIFPKSAGQGGLIGSLFKVLLSLLEHSSVMREQIIETQGFQIISMLLKTQPSSAPFWTPDDIDVIGRILSFCSSNQQLWNLAVPYLIVNNFQIWSQTHSLTQISLFESIRQRVQANSHYWRNNVRIEVWLSLLRKYYSIDPEHLVVYGDGSSNPYDISVIERVKKARSQIIVILRELSNPIFTIQETKWIALYLRESPIENQEDLTKMLEDIIPPLNPKETWYDDIAQQQFQQQQQLLLQYQQQQQQQQIDGSNESNPIMMRPNFYSSTQIPLPKHIAYLWDIDTREEYMKRREDLIQEEKQQYLLFRFWIKQRRIRSGNLNGIIVASNCSGPTTNIPIIYKLKELGINASTNNSNQNINTSQNQSSSTVLSPTVQSPIGSPIVLSPSSSPPKSSPISQQQMIQPPPQQILEPEDTTVVHWKLDRTEGPSRMRRKLKRNYLGSDYKGISKQNKFSRNRRVVKDIYYTGKDTFYIDQDCGDGIGHIIVSIYNDPPLHPLSTSYKEIELSLMNSQNNIINNFNILQQQQQQQLTNSLNNYNNNTNNNNNNSNNNSILSTSSLINSPLATTTLDGTITLKSSKPTIILSPPSSSSEPSSSTSTPLSPLSLVDNIEKFIGSYQCQLVTPVGLFSGKLTITTHCLTFDKDQKYDKFGKRIPDPDYGSVRIKNTYMWRVRDLTEIHRRRYLLRWNSIELFLNHKTYMITFATEQESLHVLNKITNLHPPNLKVKWSESPDKILKRSKLTRRWKNREISNFEYLMLLNTIAGRTYNDISQYPIFPHVIADYRSEQLDLNNENIFRDLSKPIGALNQQRLDTLIQRYKSLNDPEIPPFLYGSHYSNFGIVAYYHLRLEPFTSYHLTLQSGVFDHQARLFESMERMWDGITSPNLADVKELTPEFFYMPEFITNNEGFNFGFVNNPSGDLILPKWANQSAELFITKNREALESEYVSMNINHWIDLIFGYKQLGKHAEEANNVFFYLTYEGNLSKSTGDGDHLDDRQSKEAQIKEFGQTPPQLFTKPHPKRKTLKELNRPRDILTKISNLFPSSLNLNLIQNLNNNNNNNNNNSLNNNNNNNNNNINNQQPQQQIEQEQYPFKILKNSLPLVHIGSCPDSDIIVLVYRDGVLAVNQFVPSPSGNLPFTFDIDKTLSTLREKQIDTLFMSDSVGCISNCFALTPDGKMLFSCANWDNIFKCSNIQNGKVHRIYRDFHRGIVTCMSLSSSGKTLATASKDTTILVWDDVPSLIKDRATPLHRLCSHDEVINCIDINEEWDLIASGSQDKKCILHTLRTGSYVRTMTHSGSVEIVKISTVGQTVITYCSNGCLYVHSFNGKLLKMEQCDEKLYDIKLTGESIKKGGVLGVGDSNQFLVTGGTKGVKIRTLPDLNIVHSFESPTTIKTIALVAHEKFMMIGLNDDNVLSLILVGFIWGATNPLIKRGSEGVSSVKKDNFILQIIYEFIYLWSRPSYLIPMLINLSGSIVFFYTLSQTDISLVVPISNSLTFLFTTLMGMILGEKTLRSTTTTQYLQINNNNHNHTSNTTNNDFNVSPSSPSPILEQQHHLQPQIASSLTNIPIHSSGTNILTYTSTAEIHNSNHTENGLELHSSTNIATTIANNSTTISGILNNSYPLHNNNNHLQQQQQQQNNSSSSSSSSSPTSSSPSFQSTNNNNTNTINNTTNLINNPTATTTNNNNNVFNTSLPEIKVAKELLEFLVSHHIDPDNSLIGCELNPTYIDGLFKLRSQNSFSKRSLIRMIKSWGSMKDDHLLREVRKMANTLNHLDFKKEHNGHQHNHNHNHHPHNNHHQQQQRYSGNGSNFNDESIDMSGSSTYIFARFEEEINRTCKLYTNPSEETLFSININHVYKLSPEILDLIKNEKYIIRLVNDPSVPFSHMLSFKERLFFNEYMEEKGINLNIFEKCKNNTISFVDLPVLKQSISIFGEIDKNLATSTFLSNVIKLAKQESRPFLDNEEFVKSIESHREKQVRSRIHQNFITLDSSYYKLHIEKKEILEGTSKNKLSQWWLTLVREHVESFLIKSGFDFNAIPPDYLEKPPQNFTIVKNNLELLHGLLTNNQDESKYQKEFIKVVNRLNETVYPMIDEFILKSKLVILDSMDLFTDPVEILMEKDLLNLDGLIQLFQKKKESFEKGKLHQMERLIKDIEYVLEMKRLENNPNEKRLDIVPISGLAFSRIHRLENETRTVLDFWKHLDNQPGSVVVVGSPTLSIINNNNNYHAPTKPLPHIPKKTEVKKWAFASEPSKPSPLKFINPSQRLKSQPLSSNQTHRADQTGSGNNIPTIINIQQHLLQHQHHHNQSHSPTCSMGDSTGSGSNIDDVDSVSSPQLTDEPDN